MLKENLLTIATLTGVGFLPLAHAADSYLDKRWYAAPFGTFIHTDNDRHAKDGWGGGLALGKIINEHFNVELKGFYDEFSGKNSGIDQVGNWRLGGGTVDVQYYFNRDKFAPYTVVGLGGMVTRVTGGTLALPRNEPGFIAEMGLGATYELSDNFLLRGDVRYRYNLNQGRILGEDQFHDMTVNLGFVIPFGAKPVYTAKVETPAAPPPPDCSTMDSDADGINDCLDRCPRTPHGSTVDAAGCPIKLILKGQHFEYDSARLTLEARGLLDEVAASLIGYPQKNDIEVHGHASSEGSDAYNMRLSKQRAASVVNYLQSKGISNKLTAIGYGETRPVADNSTEAGRSENRRVELIWIQN